MTNTEIAIKKLRERGWKVWKKEEEFIVLWKGYDLFGNSWSHYNSRGLIRLANCGRFNLPTWFKKKSRRVWRRKQRMSEDKEIQRKELGKYNIRNFL